MAVTYHVEDEAGSSPVGIVTAGAAVTFSIGGRELTADVRLLTPDCLSLGIGRESYKVHFVETGPTVVLCVRGEYFELEVLDERQKAVRDCSAGTGARDAGGARQIRSRIPGKVVSVLVRPGDTVAAGDKLLIVEAMKMENEIRSPGAGRVTQIHVAAGTTVESGGLLVDLAPIEAAGRS